MINAATNLARERLLFAFAFLKGWFRGDLLFMIAVRKLLRSVQERWRWRTNYWSSWSDTNLWNCYFVDSLWFPPSLIWSVLANFRSPRPLRCAKSSPFVWVKVHGDWKARRDKAKEGECGIYSSPSRISKMSLKKTGRRWVPCNYCLFDCPLRGAGVTLWFWRMVSDQLIIWYYDTLSIMTASPSS